MMTLRSRMAPSLKYYYDELRARRLPDSNSSSHELSTPVADNVYIKIYTLKNSFAYAEMTMIIE